MMPVFLALKEGRHREWRHHPKKVELIWGKFGQMEVDLSASESHSEILFRRDLLAQTRLMVDLVAIAAILEAFGDGPLGRPHLVTKFLYGSLRLRLAVHARFPAWYLVMVFEGLSLVPFKLMDSV